MSEPTRSILSLDAEAAALTRDLRVSTWRSPAIDLLYEIVDGYVATTIDALTPPSNRGPLISDDYNLEDWLGPWQEFSRAVDDEYEATFGTQFAPNEEEILAFLARHTLTVSESGTATLLHHAWLGIRATWAANAVLAALIEGLDPTGESEQRQAEVRRLTPLLRYELPWNVLSSLVSTLFDLSRVLAHEAATRDYPKHVRAMLEWRGSFSPIPTSE